MKKLLVLALLLTVGLSFGQEKETIIFNTKTAEKNQYIKARIQNYNPKTTYILDVETANDLMVLDNTIIDSTGVFNFYIDKIGKHLGTFRKVNDSNGEKEFLQTIILNITPELTAFSIEKIDVLSFAKTKGYESWDNAMNSYLPDVYIDLMVDNNIIYSSGVQSNMKPDVPFSYSFNGKWKLGINKEFNQKNMIKILLYDKDSYSDHDFIGGFQFNRGSIPVKFPKGNITGTQEYYDQKRQLKIIIHYKWSIS